MAATDDILLPVANGVTKKVINDGEGSISLDDSLEVDERMDLERVDFENALQGKLIIDRLPPSIYQNMMNEFTDVDTFVISMDSLLVEIMLHDNLSWTLGGQSLVVVYMLECFLKSLEDKGGRFQLVWFDDLESCFVGNSTAQLMREIVKKHFTVINSLKQNVISFQSPFSSQWFAYVKQLSPSFLFCSNGTLDQEQFSGFDCDKFKECMTSLIYYCCGVANIATVSFDGMQQNAATLFAYRTEPIAFPAKDVINLWMQTTWESLKRTNGNSSSQLDSPNMHTIIDFWSAVTKKFLEISTGNRQVYETYCKIFLQSVDLQQKLPLELRAQSLPKLEDLPQQASTFISELCSTAANILHSLSEPVQFPVYDLIDGRLFAYLISFDKDLVDTTCLTKRSLENALLYQIQPLKHGLFELYAKDVAKSVNDALVDTDKSKIPTISNHAHQFFERRRWVSGRLIEEDFSNKKYAVKPGSSKKKEAMKDNRGKQNLAKWYDFYGESLEGRSQKVLFHPPSKEHVKKTQTAATAAPQAEKNKKSSVKTLSKAEVIIAKNKSEKMTSKVDEEIKSVENAVKKKLPIPHPSKLSTAEGKANAIFQQALLLKQIVLDKRKQNLDEKRSVSVDLFLKLDELMHKESGGKKFVDILIKKNQIMVEQMWQELGFEIQKEPTEVKQGNNPSQSMNLEMNIVDYRLAYAGESIEIQSDQLPDDRVEGFVPDVWQRVLLDAVDHNQSGLIIAPTSSGKTFISYYCIEKVLRESTDGVVVYVCPTKALLNQVAATISARFRHANLQPGQALFGIYVDKNYRKDVLTCRVLITIPQCLETLLLLPQCTFWCQKLKYAIFDEVHCIGGGVGDILGSEVWEHIILLINCPFLALSATVGNTDVLHQWLAQAEQAKMGSARQVKLVKYNERYSELELFMFDIFDSSTKQLLELNPLAVCKTEKIKHFGLPTDQQLTARQIFNLWEAIKSMKNDIGLALKPSTFFKDVTATLLRQDIRNYENNLKQQFVELVKEDKNVEDKLTSDFFGNVDIQLSKRSDTFSAIHLARNGIAELIMCLRDKEMLPCLCFSDNRSICVTFAQKVEEYLEKAQFDFQKQNPEFERTQQNLAKQQEKNLKRQRDKKEKKHTGSKDKDNKEEKDEKDDDGETILIKLDDNSAFKLSKPGTDLYLYEKVIQRLERKDAGLESTKLLLKCIERGIGFHHPGMSTTQRQSVEILFRSGHLQVVFSTGTLALGINMPCKSVVLTTDSPYLTPLQYRQMIGRAGRRGFDKSGNVIIYSVPTMKIMRLLTSALPNLRANLPFTVSYIIRLLALVANAPETKQKSCMKSISAMLLQPFLLHTLAQQKENLQKQLEHYFVFGCHFLNRMMLIDSKMQPTGLAGIVTHLSYHEPGNFIFVHFLQNGAFHALCEKYSGAELQDKLVLIMSHLFTRTIVHNAQKYHDTDGQLQLSKVVLGDLPKEFTLLLKSFNNEVCSFYVAFLKSLTGHLFPVGEPDKGNDSKTLILPYSRTLMPSPTIPAENINGIAKKLIASKTMETKIGGPIFSITGVDDYNLDLINLKLVYPLRQGIYYDQGFVPAALNRQKNHRGEPVALNSYAFDFWKHESIRALLSENKILEGDAYQLLNDFCLVLKSVTAAMEELAPKPTTDIVACAFKSLANDYEDKFNYAFDKKPRPI